MLFKGSFYLIFALLFASLVSACSNQKTEISSTGDSRGLKYSVVSKTEALADGFTDLTVEVLVEDLLGHVMAGYTPPTKSLNANGINFASCAPSNPSGISICTFRSQLEGTKSVSFGSATVTVIKFNPMHIKVAGQFGIVPSIQINETASDGSFVSSSVGHLTDHPKQRSPSWVVFTDPAIRQ